ncbi:MAG: hypothetical protein ACXVZO_00455 [Gaiellaceae bacterium]
MAVIMMFEAPGASLGDYEEVNAVLGIQGDDDAPDGLIWHAACQTNDGVQIVDVWESEQKLGRFFEDRLQAALAQVGIEPAEPRIVPVYKLYPRGSGSYPGVLAVIEIDGLGSDVYDRMASGMEAHSADDGSRLPAVAHTAGVTENGMLIVDVWDSPESFARFAESQIAPAGRAAGLGSFEPSFLPIHNFIRSKAAVRVS